MALTWDLTRVPEKTWKYPNRLNPTTEALIWFSIMTGIAEITAKNAAEVFNRISFYEKLEGAMLQDGGGDKYPITFEQVRAHIGLRTNASPKTKGQFAANVYRVHCEREARKQREAA